MFDSKKSALYLTTKVTNVSAPEYKKAALSKIQSGFLIPVN